MNLEVLREPMAPATDNKNDWSSKSAPEISEIATLISFCSVSFPAASYIKKCKKY